jgi:tetratricopeptide (TPR) repeat protein
MSHLCRFLVFLLLVIPLAGNDRSHRLLPATQLVHLSREKAGQNDLQGALDLARSAVAADPAFGQAWKQQGRVQMLLGNLDQALDSLEKADRLLAKDAQVQVWIIRILSQQQDFEKLVERMDNLPETAAELIDDSLIRDFLLKLLGRPEQRLAERMCRRWEALSRRENSRRAATALRAVISGEPERAESVLKTTPGIQEPERPLVALAWTQIGLAHLQHRRIEAAAAALERSLELLPDDLTSLRELGWAYRSLGRNREAAVTWRKGIAKSDQAATWWTWIAEAQLESGDLNSALQAVGQGLASTPGHERARTLKLMLLLLEGDEGSVRRYENQLDLQPDGRQVKGMGRALAHRRQGEFEAAAREFEGLLQAGPEDRELKNLLADSYARWASQAGVTGAVEPLQKLVALDPARVGAWRDLGWSHWSQGRHLEAIQAWDKAFSNGIDNHNELAEQLIGVIAEEECPVSIAGLYRAWRPGASLLDLGLKFFSEGRREAARIILVAACESPEKLPVAGLHLAYLEARTGRCDDVPDRLLPFLRAHLPDLSADQVDMATAALRNCRANSVLAVAKGISGRLRGAESLLAKQIAELLQQEGNARRAAQDEEGMLAHYAAAVELDASQLDWSSLVSLQNREVAENIRALLIRTADQTSSGTVREGIRGWLEFSQGNPAGAIQHYQASLAGDADQPELRLALLRLLVGQDRFEEARSASQWFKEEITGGRTALRSYLAEAHTLLGETSEAVELWRQSHLSYPGSPHYAMEYARQLARNCQPEEAVEVIQSLLALGDYPRALELQAEIAADQGRPAEVLELTERGLALENSRGLLRLRLEAAEELGQYQSVIEAARALMAKQEAAAPAVAAVLRALFASGRYEEAERLASDSLQSDPAFLQAFLQLRDLAILKGDIRRRIELEEVIQNLRPWDTDARRRLALAWAEAGDFHTSRKVLGPLAASSPSEAIPLLVYQRLTSCDCPGRNTSSQLVSHLHWLAGTGYRLVTPADLRAGQSRQPAMVMLLDPEPESLPEIDRLLGRIGGRAMLVLSSAHQRTGVQGTVPAQLLASLQANGRWLVASRGRFGIQTAGNRTGAPQDPAADPVDLAYTSDPAGFVRMEETSPMPFPGRSVPASWTSEELARHMTRNPLVVARLDLAKTLSWSRQFERADRWFRRAREAGADPAELYYHWGVNAYHEGDLPSALQRLRQASALAPESQKIKSALTRAENRKDFVLTLNGRNWEDSDDRRAVSYGAELGGYLHDRFRAGIFADRNRWERENWTGERGTRSGASLLTHLGGGWRLQAEAWSLNLDGPRNRLGWKTNLHLPMRAWSGWVELDAERDEIGTLEALQQGLRASRYGVTGYTRLATSWDFTLSPSFTNRTDGNATRTLEGRLVYRAMEWPFLGIGYSFRVADSDRNPPEYWAPVGLQQHQIYVALRGDAGRLRYALTGRGGYADQQGTDWRFTWGIRPQVGLRLTQRLSLTGEFIRLDTPVYRAETWLVGLTQRF